MAADLLITFTLILLITAIISIIYIIPLDISLIIERQGTVALLYAGATWSIFSCAVDYRDGAGSFNLLLGGKRIWRRPLEPLVRAGEPAVPWDFGTATGLIRKILLLGPGVMRIIRALLRHTRIRRLSCNVRFGISSPAITGMLFGWYAALRPLLMRDDRVSLFAEPVFDRDLFEGSCRCDFRIDRPGVIPALVIRLLLDHWSWSIVRYARPDRQGVAA